MTVNILVTNDDGVYSNGIKSLAHEMSKIGNVHVVAPLTEKSATSHSLTLHRPLRVKQINKHSVYAVNGTPTDCVNLAINGLLKIKTDIIISGINIGPNLADDITYSGTVAAAIEGTLQGIPSIAISVAGRKKIYFKPAQDVANKLIRKVLKNGLPENVFLNVNVPNIPSNKIMGYRYTRLGKRRYGEPIVEKADPRGEKYYWIGGDVLGDTPVENSDIKAVEHGYISITPIKLDLTDYNFLEHLLNWRL